MSKCVETIKIHGSLCHVRMSARGYVQIWKVGEHKEGVYLEMDGVLKEKLTDDVKGWEREMSRLREQAILLARKQFGIKRK